jgi:cytochrome c peroxidase
VIRHYESGVVERSTVAKELVRPLRLSDGERADLLAFLRTLTSEDDPALPRRIAPGKAGPTTPASRVSTVAQDEKNFYPGHVALKRGERLWIVNNDGRTHNVRIVDPNLDFDSGAQEPGETVQIVFPAEGTFLVFCAIHPKMELYVEVAP